MVDSTAASLTVKVATPEALVTPETVVIVEEPPLFASVTVLPETGFDFASFSVTVIVEVVLPSARTDVGEAVTVDWAARHGAGGERDGRGLGDGDRVGGVGGGVGGRFGDRVLDGEGRLARRRW